MKTLENNSEKSILDQIKKGDYQAFKWLFDSHYAYLIRTAYHFIPDQDTCKDIVQEVFFEFWKKREMIEIHSSVKAYLRQSVVNKSLNFIKSNKKYQWEDSSEAIQISSKDSNAQQSMEANDLQNSINKAIDDLPEKCRLVFTMSRLENMSHKEISTLLDISVKTIENHMTKALKLLKNALEKGGYISILALFYYFMYSVT